MLNPLSRAVRLRDGIPVLPGAFPVLGHLPAALHGAPALLRRARADIGPVFWLSAGFGQWVIVCTGKEALDLFRNKSFSSGHLETISPLVAGQSLLAQEGALHRHMRTAMNGPFLPRGLSASTIGPMMARVLSDLAARWAAQDRVRVVPEIQDAALEIIFRMLGVDPSDLPAWRTKYRRLLLANVGIKADFPGSPARAKAWIDARFRDLVAAARTSPQPGTLLSELVNGRDEEGQSLTDQELVDNLRLLVLGGHETISATMAWIVLNLAHDAALWDALSAEASRGEVPATPQEAKNFPFAEGLFRETVRMYPPFSLITRRCEEAYSLHEKTIPAGAIVAVDLWGIAHDPGLFPEPDDYRPSRWTEAKSPPTPIEISQFGAGPHFCLGYHLAWLEAMQFAVALARALTAAGKRPMLPKGRLPEPIYLPTEHPPAGSVVLFSRASS